MDEIKTASIILAAGRGSRMEGFSGNKALLPLIPGSNPYHGEVPIIEEIIRNLPVGPKAVVVHHRKKDILDATRNLNLTYCEQPELNGTGGALIAADHFVKLQDCRNMIIAMGDVPFVKKSTHLAMIKKLIDDHMVILGFRPRSKKQYGVLEIKKGSVNKIIEWKYWKEFPEEIQKTLEICNSGIYAVRREELMRYTSILQSRPHNVQKSVDGKFLEINEYFITDLVEYMSADGLSVGYIVASNEEEVMGIDDPRALIKAQEIFGKRFA